MIEVKQLKATKQCLDMNKCFYTLQWFLKEMFLNLTG